MSMPCDTYKGLKESANAAREHYQFLTYSSQTGMSRTTLTYEKRIALKKLTETDKEVSLHGNCAMCKADGTVSPYAK